MCVEGWMVSGFWRNVVRLGMEYFVVRLGRGIEFFVGGLFLCWLVW